MAAKNHSSFNLSAPGTRAFKVLCVLRSTEAVAVLKSACFQEGMPTLFGHFWNVSFAVELITSTFQEVVAFLVPRHCWGGPQLIM